MFVSEKSHQNLFEHIQFLYQKKFSKNKRKIISSETMKHSGNCNHNFAHSLFGKDL